MPASAFIEALRANMHRALRERSKGDAEQILAQLKREDPLSETTRAFESSSIFSPAVSETHTRSPSSSAGYFPCPRESHTSRA
jgi:hypothetical protein